MDELTISSAGDDTECGKCEVKSDDVVSLEVKGVVIFVCQNCLTDAVNDAVENDVTTRISA